mmetsp:Transcript_131134/g.331064  ORF Transcript_131134/g.331064 Transcript_131134/m.331064 type:complete len:215 (+) Transcript_131134:313-957(+)
MTGMAILPQLSPATMVWKKVMLASKTEEKDLLHRVQSDHSPLSERSRIIGLTISTAIVAQMVIARIKRRNDQNNVLKHEPIMRSNFLNSFKMLKSLITRMSRSKRHNLMTRMIPLPDISSPVQWRMYSMLPVTMMKKSKQFHMFLNTTFCSTVARIPNSTTKKMKQVPVRCSTHWGADVFNPSSGEVARASVSMQMHTKFARITIANEPSKASL